MGRFHDCDSQIAVRSHDSSYWPNSDRKPRTMSALKNDTAAPRRDVLERLFNLSPAMLCIAGTDTHFRRVNPAFMKKLGHTEPEILSCSFIEFVHPDDRESTLNEVQKLSTGTPTVHFENRYRHADGSYRWLLWNTTPMVDEGLLYATAIDITERKQADERFRKLQEDSAQELAENERKLQALTNRLVLAEENERRRIARGLHDDVGQSLLAAKMATEELEDSLTGDGRSLAVEVRQLLEHAIRSTRSLTFDLASEVLYDVGLGAALQSVCERAEQQSGIRFQSPESLKGNPIPEAARFILYRVGSELIQNIVRHSGARTAQLSLTLNRGVVRLTVQDDGCGFDAVTQRQCRSIETGFGLFSIDQQLGPIGGKLEIVSTPGSGTQAVVIFPLPTEAATT